jgi:RNA polymerase sigma-70 factor, ECF subfamily
MRRRNAMICNEAELAERASMHDQEAFAELYNAYVEKIYKYIYYKVGNAPDAEDLCEQVFLKAWEAIGRYKWFGYPFSSWLYKLAHNLVVDHYRTRRDQLQLNDAIFTPDEHAETEQILYSAVEATEIRKAMAQLTPEQRQVIGLKFLEGYKNAEIAEMLRKKEGAIRALQYRALRSLQAILEAEEEAALEFAVGYMDATAG